MNRILKLLLLIQVVILAGLSQANAQAHLVISQLINYPDTAIVDSGVTTYSISAVVENVGNAPYLGTIRIAYFASPSGNYGYLTQNSNVVTLLPQDTITLFNQGYSFDTINYKMGNNVVVVWPYSTQFVLIDSFYTSVYIDTPSSVTSIREHPEIKGLNYYPVPAMDELIIVAEETLESVRIYDLSGRTVLTLPAGRTKTPINLEGILPGTYLAEITSSQHTRSVIRFVKL